MRNVIVLAVILAVGIGIFVYRHDSASRRIKTEMLAIAQDMKLSPPEHAEVSHLIMIYHEQTFNEALDISKRRGDKFDVQMYYDGIFNLLLESLRTDDQTALADKIEKQKGYFTLKVTEC